MNKEYMSEQPSISRRSLLKFGLGATAAVIAPAAVVETANSLLGNTPEQECPPFVPPSGNTLFYPSGSVDSGRLEQLGFAKAVLQENCDTEREP